ncbi:MAG: aspartate aminotransferase family protein [Acutalibacteraceae bacterium]|nr:aspartate aminotransferase family protein [Acutalibacteraceae bacterium]
MDSIAKMRDDNFHAKTYARFPLVIKSGKGSLVYDENGKEYIDLSSGIAVNTFGVADDEWVKAVTKQLGQLQHMSNLFYTEPVAALAEKLCKKVNMQRAFFCNSGAEANECAIKAARKYSQEKYKKERYKIITLVNSFHGRTMATLTATGQDVFHKDFTPMLDGFYYAEAGNLEQVENFIKNGDTAAIMFEIVQGEGGVMPLNKDFVTALDNIAKQNDILLICDEVQCGNGRCGTYFAYEQYGISPDIVTTAKGLGGGLPIGATLFGEKTQDVLVPSSHGSTFGGNPVCAAAALNVVDRIDENLLNEVIKKGNYIKETLCGKDGIKSVSGLGLMLGLETEKPAAEIVQKCRENGVIVITAKTKVRLLPPLNIPWELLQKAVDVIIDACK